MAEVQKEKWAEEPLKESLVLHDSCLLPAGDRDELLGGLRLQQLHPPLHLPLATGHLLDVEERHTQLLLQRHQHRVLEAQPDFRNVTFCTIRSPLF